MIRHILAGLLLFFLISQGSALTGEDSATGILFDIVISPQKISGDRLYDAATGIYHDIGTTIVDYSGCGNDPATGISYGISATVFDVDCAGNTLGINPSISVSASPGHCTGPDDPGLNFGLGISIENTDDGSVTDRPEITSSGLCFTGNLYGAGPGCTSPKVLECAAGSVTNQHTSCRIVDNAYIVQIGSSASIQVTYLGFSSVPTGYGSMYCGDGTARSISCFGGTCTIICGPYNNIGGWSINSLLGLTNGTQAIDCLGNATIIVNAWGAPTALAEADTPIDAGTSSTVRVEYSGFIAGVPTEGESSITCGGTAALLPGFSCSDNGDGTGTCTFICGAYADEGTYTIDITLGNGSNTASATAGVIVVLPPPAAPEPNLTIFSADAAPKIVVPDSGTTVTVVVKNWGGELSAGTIGISDRAGVLKFSTTSEPTGDITGGGTVSRAFAVTVPPGAEIKNYPVKITLSDSAGNVVDTETIYLNVIRPNAVAVPEIPPMFAALAALGVLLILWRRK